MIALLATAALVFLRAVQQLNVVHSLYLPAAVTSYLIAAAEIGVILSIVDQGWSAVVYIGTGGAIGVTLAMTFHRIMRKIFSKALDTTPSKV